MASNHRKRVTSYFTEEERGMLNYLIDLDGVTIASMIRTLVRKEYSLRTRPWTHGEIQPNMSHVPPREKRR